MLALWALAVVTVAAYYSSASFAEALNPLLRWQRESGWWAAFLNRVIFCGLLPGLVFCLCRSLRPRHPLTVLFVQSLWCGLWGIATDYFYRWQDLFLGAGTDAGTAFLKMCVNQLPWTVLVVAPVNAVFYFWIGRDFSFARTRADWPKGAFVREILAPNLLTNWCVWIPVNFIVYLFPLPLRVQLSGFAGCFWTLACLQIGRRSARRS